MTVEQLLALAIFLATIAFIIWGVIDRAITAFIGAILMVLLGVISEVEAFYAVDWNVIGILVGIWIIAGYFGESGLPAWLAHKALKASKGSPSAFILLIGFIAAMISMFVDNVVVVLMMAPVVLHLSRKLKFNPAPYIIFTALSANFMGTALLLGDLPPQLLHSVTGIEFLEFVWQYGRPSSFPILLGTFMAVLVFFRWKFKSRRWESKTLSGKLVSSIKDRRLAIISVSGFVLTVAFMALRQSLGIALGFITISGAAATALAIEISNMASGKRDRTLFEKVLAELDWRAIFFYILLFVLVGGIDKAGIIRMLADWLAPQMAADAFTGVTILYWITAPIVAVVEHDAYILTFLHVIKDLAVHHGVEAWPLYWALVWSGTLGSNLTVAGAPALYVALNICEREGYPVTLRRLLAYTVPFVLVSLVVCYLLALAFWVSPYL
ncbi:MAG: SLC13 family permease [Candidatus Hecatellaceae archaeon]